ncbi:MAG: hypothetical protein A2283_06795 [Lentisphaerae bacterium RIFOXYA12_FULL_48_11]|nr:MAG: hypothetical protein A2283_06795 [Lentisphaerae bacterium RIFOXYA12_FULL_48_11]
MRQVILTVIVVVVGSFVQFWAHSADRVVADGVAAQVNNNFITISDVMLMVQPAQRQLAAKYSGVELKSQMQVVFSNALNSLIERKLILDAYEKQENKFPDAYLDSRVEEITQDMFSGDKADLMTALAKEKLNYEEWRKDMRDHVIASTMRKMHVEQNIAVSAKAVKKAYDENIDRYRANSKLRLRMIVLTMDASAPQKAQEIRQKIIAGADFSETAKEVSEGRNAKEGGDWGLIQPSKLRPELAETVLKLKPGEISQVVSIEDQCYIMKVEEKKDSYSDLHSQIESEIRKVEADKLHAVWIERLRKDAYVKVFDTGLF